MLIADTVFIQYLQKMQKFGIPARQKSSASGGGFPRLFPWTTLGVQPPDHQDIHTITSLFFRQTQSVWNPDIQTSKTFY